MHGIIYRKYILTELIPRNRLVTYSTLREISQREQFRVCQSGDTRTSLVSYKDDMNHARSERSRRESKLSPRQEIKLGRACRKYRLSITTVPYATEETILLIKTIQLIQQIIKSIAVVLSKITSFRNIFR